MASITITIPDAKLTEFKSGFLKRQPVPVDNDTGEPEMSENAWIKEWVKQQLLHYYKSGKKQLAQEAASIDQNIVE